MQYTAYRLTRNARKQLQNRYPWVDLRMQLQRTFRRLSYCTVIVIDLHAGLCEQRIVARVECVKLHALHLTRPVTPKEFVIKIDAHLGNNRLAFPSGRCNLDGGDKILTCVRPRL